jgi:hypothetical protein
MKVTSNRISAAEKAAGSSLCSRCLEAATKQEVSAAELSDKLERLRQQREDYASKRDLLEWAEHNEKEAGRLRELATHRF